MKKSILSRISLFLLLSIVYSALLISCAGGNYSGLRLSNDVTRLFESYQVLDDHNYYYSGSDARPNAILGVHKDYTLRSNLWKPVRLTPDHLKLWINMMTDHRGTTIRPFGSRVVAPDGKDIGIWYSPWKQTRVRMEDDRHVFINTPTPSPDNRKRGLIFGLEKD
ncbi:MAG: hypothetical protein MUD09_10080 [Desulfobacterales bacterium]|nr:hypothetical protein [Desulfobacterales bacterium]